MINMQAIQGVFFFFAIFIVYYIKLETNHTVIKPETKSEKTRCVCIIDIQHVLLSFSMTDDNDWYGFICYTYNLSPAPLLSPSFIIVVAVDLTIYC